VFCFYAKVNIACSAFMPKSLSNPKF